LEAATAVVVASFFTLRDAFDNCLVLISLVFEISVWIAFDDDAPDALLVGLVVDEDDDDAATDDDDDVEDDDDDEEDDVGDEDNLFKFKSFKL